MYFNFKEILSVSMILFAIIDILGSIPIIIDFSEMVGRIGSGQTCLVGMGIMIAVLFIGGGLLRISGVYGGLLSIPGWSVIFFTAMEPVLGMTVFKDAGHE